jgi:hypothetical protein
MNSIGSTNYGQLILVSGTSSLLFDIFLLAGEFSSSKFISISLAMSFFGV